MEANKNRTLSDLNQLEWVHTNGLGGYTSSTITGCNTRRYHGILVASMNPPTDRHVLVSKIEEYITNQRDTYNGFSSNQYSGAVHPKGFQYLTEFNRDPLPRSVFDIGENKIAKTVFMVHHSNTTIVEYENIGDTAYQLKLTPFFVDRNYHSLFLENTFFDYYIDFQSNVLKIYSHFGANPVYVKFFNGAFTENRHWIKRLEYEQERSRGLDYQEDVYAIGDIRFFLNKGQKAYLMFTTDPEILDEKPANLKLNALHRLQPNSKEDKFLNDLKTAANQFIVWRASTQSYTILAGYHWFTDWGRDTMIAMRGLTIATGKQEVSKSILQTFFKSIHAGMLPNRFPDFEGEAIEYNTIDASLWLFVALYEYYKKFEDRAFVEANFDGLTDIIQWHIKGTRYRIQVTAEGFLSGGEGIAQLTWMDARIGDHVVTPRHGCPVEIQALWYNALKIYQELALELEIPDAENMIEVCKSTADLLATNFKSKFLNEAGYLNDVVGTDLSVDTSIRPNQIYVISLPFELLPKEDAERVFDTVKTHLYTPYGLRTLSPKDTNFKPTYGGSQWDRDTAYHQGTVWPFLLGDYFLAQLKLKGNTPATKSEIRTALNTLIVHFYESGCIHGISEIFDGLHPETGKGTVQQAWSVSAMLQVLLALQ